MKNEKLFIDNWFKLPPKEQDNRSYIVDIKRGKNERKHNKKTKKRTSKKRG